ncbi:hypothetical protein CR513_01815, partial [Mucuna pruriens]
MFYSYNPCGGNKKVKITYGSLSTIIGIGTIKLSPLITLHNVLHVLNLSCNMLSISKITSNYQRQVNFYSSSCVFHELTIGRMIDSAKERDGLYYFDVGPNLSHPSFQYLKFLFPNLFINKSFFLQCKICQFAKHHHTSFPSQSYKQIAPFTIIHSDI